MTLNEMQSWKVKKKMLEKAVFEKGFSIEESDSIYCKCNCPSMTESQFALICNRCGEAYIQGKSEYTFEKLKTLSCTNEKCCSYDFIEKTIKQELIWIPDIMGYFNYIVKNVKDEILSPKLNDEKEWKHIIFTASRDYSNQHQDMLVFYHLFNEERYINLLLLINLQSCFKEATAQILWESYLDELFLAILGSLADEIDNKTEFINTIDGYIQMYRAFRKYDVEMVNSIWPENSKKTVSYDSISVLLDRYSSEVNNYDETKRRQDTIKALYLQSCAKCKILNLSTEKCCTSCGFSELDSFIAKKPNDTEYNEKKKMETVEVVAALIWERRKNNEDKFMICQRPVTKARGLLWEFVGGKVEPGETKEQALVRECCEELAITVAPEDIFKDVVHEYPDFTIHLTLYNCTIAEGEPKLLEHNDLKWITSAEINNYDFCPADTEILKLISEKKF